MKRLMTIFAVTAAIFASCSKSEPESGNKDANESGNITLKLSVSEFGGADSKAPIKTGWAEGDQLLIWFDANAGEKPDMVIKYNGIGWEKDGAAQVSGNTPAASGNMKVLYNNILCVTAKDPYTYNSSTSTLSGRIQTWTFLTEIQVVVTGLKAADYAKYTLSCSNFTPFTGYTVGTESITATAGVANTAVSGMSNADGVAFVFASCTEYGKSAGYKFTLKDGSSSGASASTPTPPEFVDLGLPSGLKWAKWNVGASKPEEYGYYFFWGGTQGYIYDTSKGYTLTKNLARNVSQIKGIKIASNKFAAVNCWVKAETGEELVGGFCWKNTPFNNGSSSYDKTYFKSVRSTVCPSDVLALDYDAAHAYCGEGYRMPTSAEFQELYDATQWTWKSKDKGYYVTEKGVALASDKSNALLFFPAAGYGGNTNLHNAGSDGNYWSSSLGSDNPNRALYLYFLSGTVDSQYNGSRYLGFTVRPVSD